MKSGHLTMTKKLYVPNRGDVICLDFEPTKGNEIGKYRPSLILSDQSYNLKTGYVICCPVSTSIRGGPGEVPLEKLDKPSVVVTGFIQTVSWKARRPKYIYTVGPDTLRDVYLRLLPIIGADNLFKEMDNT